jgi:exonuclease III
MKSQLEKDLEDATTSTTSDGTKKDKTTRDDKLTPELKEKKQKLNTLNSSIQTIILTPTYVPNTRDHLYKYAAKMEHTNAFTCDISEETVDPIP